MTPDLFTPQPRTYFDSVPERSENIAKYSEKAKLQENIVLEFFQRNATQSYTPGQVMAELIESGLFSSRVPATSCRRSITCLTQRGKLFKTGEKRKSDLGRNTNCWKLL